MKKSTKIWMRIVSVMFAVLALSYLGEASEAQQQTHAIIHFLEPENREAITLPDGRIEETFARINKEQSEHPIKTRQTIEENNAYCTAAPITAAIYLSTASLLMFASFIPQREKEMPKL